MDTFIDKLAQKKNAQEMIRANSAAEAAKMEQMQKQLQTYDELLQEIRRVNLRTAENLETMRRLLAQCIEKLENAKTEEPAENAEEQLAAVKGLLEEQLPALKSLLEERLTQTEGIVHKENVKVYRNVQAAFTEELEKQNRQEQENKENGGGKMPAGLSLAILIGVIVDIVINLIPFVLQLTNVKLF
ncbi:MAG: hypothetical protein K2N43_01115 [Lachnospiraceae bacterium]|nr:hypothetical protein [Lachnospiraceae bacterium]